MAYILLALCTGLRDSDPFSDKESSHVAFEVVSLLRCCPPYHSSRLYGLWVSKTKEWMPQVNEFCLVLLFFKKTYSLLFWMHHIETCPYLYSL
jgi:hypothetical protein